VPYLFAGAGVVFSIVLFTRMGHGEFMFIGATCLVALLNWFIVKKRPQPVL
jgi:branched-subunit amino acid ABC-type transport system permease component